MTEEVCVSGNKGTAKGESTLVLREPGNRSRPIGAIRANVIEEVAGKKGIALIELVCTAVELVAAAFRDNLRLRTGVAAKLSVEVVRDEFEFLNSVKAECSEARLAGGGDVAANDVVDGDIVCTTARTVAVVASSTEEGIILGNRNGSGAESGIRHWVASLVGQLDDRGGIDGLAYLRCCNIQDRLRAFNGDCLGSGTNLQ